MEIPKFLESRKCHQKLWKKARSEPHMPQPAR